MRLLTKDGEVLKASDTTGLAAQEYGNGKITAKVFDSSNGNALSGVPVQLVRGSSIYGTKLARKVTDSTGTAVFDAPYGYYSTIVDFADFKLGLGRIFLQ